jgi:hypothetical protein
MKKMIELRNAVPKATIWNKCHGTTPTNTQGTYNADILPGHSIRIFGTMTNHVRGPQEFDQVFKIGDAAVYGSFNLIYTGKITAIGPKTVTVKHYEHSSEVTMLQVYGFIDQNWDYNAEKIAKHNSTESQCI